MRGPVTLFQAWRRRRATGRARGLRDRSDLLRESLDDEGAWTLLEKSLRLNPHSSGSVLRAARLRQRLGQGREVADAWRRVTDDSPALAEAWVGRARAELDAGDLGAARAHAERALALDLKQGPFSDADFMRHLIAHVDAQQSQPTAQSTAEPAFRHIAIGGISYCGSTLLGYLLGALPGVQNVGESHWLVNRREGPFTHPTDFDVADPALRSVCNHCGTDCSAFPDAFRRDLAKDPADWYQRIARQVDTEILVSSDKNPPKLRVLDPGLRFDLIVSFRLPTVSWNSTRRKAHVDTPLRQHLIDWHEAHSALLNGLPNRGRVVCLNFDALRRDPEPHLKRLCELLELPFAPEALELGAGPPQHTFGGNPRAHQSLDAGDREIQRADDPVEVPADERERLAEYEARSPILASLLAEHRRNFS